VQPTNTIVLIDQSALATTPLPHLSPTTSPAPHSPLNAFHLWQLLTLIKKIDFDRQLSLRNLFIYLQHGIFVLTTPKGWRRIYYGNGGCKREISRFESLNVFKDI